MPISTAINMLFDEQPSVYITARINDQSRMDEAKAQIATYLRERHTIEKDSEENYQDDFDLTTLQDVIGAEQEAANTFSRLLVAMATVSLIVGGIGIMNVMMVSVTERTREIGVRMAVGARGRDVIGQFLLEADILSAVGGVLGIAVIGAQDVNFHVPFVLGGGCNHTATAIKQRHNRGICVALFCVP